MSAEMIDMSPEACVARGVEFLDSDRPGWRDAIDLDELAVEDSGRCILGQVYAEDSRQPYHDQVTRLNGLGLSSWMLGFSGTPKTAPTPEECYELLNAEWKRVIHASRELVPA